MAMTPKPPAPSADPLHAAVEKAMRAKQQECREHDQPFTPEDAVSVAVEMIRQERETAEYWSKSNIATANLAVSYLKRAEAAEKKMRIYGIANEHYQAERDEARKALAETQQALMKARARIHSDICSERRCVSECAQADALEGKR